MKRVLFVVLFFVFSQSAIAQDSLVAKEAPKAPDKKTLGWTPIANVSVNAAVSSASNVVGQTDGSSENYGLDLRGGASYADIGSDWMNTLSYTGSTAKTPVQPRYVKSTDLLKFESLGLYSIPSAPKFGPYAKVSADSPIFFGEDVRPAVSTYNFSYRDGTSQQVSSNTLHLTDGFKPLTTKESVGGFWKAFDDGNVHFNTRLGIGAEQVAADGQLAVTGVAADGSVSVSELKSVSQLGVEAEVSGKGRIDEKSLWEVGVETLTPFISNKDASDNRDPIRLTNINGNAKLSVKLATWASLVYDYKVVIEPQLLDRTQQSNMLVLNLNTNIL